MNCSYHVHNAAVTSCNGCGKALCPACDHRIKGFPYCQDCIVQGVELLREQSRSNYAPYVKRRTSPIVATLLSLICPGLGAAYNGQTTKAIVYFMAFVGLFQMAVLTGGMPLFVFGFLGMWVFGAFDSWRTAQVIRSGVTPDNAEDILVKRFSGNPVAWGIVLLMLGAAAIIRSTIPGAASLMRYLLPVVLIGLGIYIMRSHIFKKKTEAPSWQGGDTATSFALSQPLVNRSGYDRDADFETRSRFGSWKDR